MKKTFLMLMVAAAAMVTVSCGKKDQAKAEGEAEQTEQKAEGETAAATAGENGYQVYENKLGYTIEIPGGLFKYKNKILDEKDGEESLLQYTLNEGNILANKLSVYFKKNDGQTAESVKEDYDGIKGQLTDEKFVKDEVTADGYTLVYERVNSVGDTDYFAVKKIFNLDKKVNAQIEFEYNKKGQDKFTEEVINHVFDSFKFN